RCNFSSRDSLAISNHLNSFHSLGPIPLHLTYTHADTACPDQDCSMSGESHFHCSSCSGCFFYGNSQGIHRCNPNKLPKMRVGQTSGMGSGRKITKACNRPFCKLKKNIVHFHCLVCSQGFTSHDRLACHLRKHQRADSRKSGSS
ncbi:hypothetical protein PFISCL1PPCAC_4687, partial [Pristionchus fissidentatus]